MIDKERYKVLVVSSKDWLKAKRSADEKPLVELLGSSPAVVFVYVNKDERHPDRWGVAAIIDTTSEQLKDILDKVARELGYVGGVLNDKFRKKHLKENCLRKLAGRG